MAGQWEDWFEREEFIGQISDLRVQNLQVEREVVQKRTFTRWMNLHLEKCDPPIEVHDLFQDIQDGRILMALLEELSGCKLLHGFKKSSHRIFRLNNIAKVLSFLEERNVKLVSIDAVDVADGNSSIILGLIWNIILFFQIKELTGNIRSQFPSCSSLSSIPTSSDSDASFCSTPSDERQSASTAIREHSKAIKKLLQWVQKRTRKYGVAVQDFGKSWTTGLAFLAVIKSIDSTLVDMRKALLRSARENLEDAFRIAHFSLGIPRLLEPEDVTINAPDEQSIIMYVSQFLEHFPGNEEPEESYQIIERSVSMGRLNFRDSDSYHLNNGLHRSRVKERSQMFQRDNKAKLPPKILISSVSEDRGIMSPTFKVAAARSWSSEDFLADSSQVESEDTKKPASEVINDSLTSTHSPTGSSIPESTNTESVVGDSAISSPDSWVESEFNVMPEKFSESRSDSSLCDSGTAWDVYRATPVDVTPHDEGFVPSLEDGAADEQSLAESYVDEGIYSLSSLESTQYKVQEKKEEEEGRDTQKDIVNHREEQANEQAAEQEATETMVVPQELPVSHQKEDKVRNQQEPSFESSNAEDLNKSADKTNQIESSCDGSPPPPDLTETLIKQNSVDKSGEHKLQEAVEFSQDVQTHEGQIKSQTEGLQQLGNSEEFGEDSGCEKAGSPSENTADEQQKTNEGSVKTQESSETLVNFSPESSQASENLHTTNQDDASNKRLEVNIPLISISSESQEQEEDKACESEGHAAEDEGQQRLPESEGAGAGVGAHHHPGDLIDASGENRDQTPAELPPCLLSKEVRPVLLEEIREIDELSSDTEERSGGGSHAEATVDPKLSESTQETVSSPDSSQTDVTGEAPASHSETQLEEDPHNEHKDKVSDICVSSETDITQRSVLDSVTSEQDAAVMGLPAKQPAAESTTKDSFYRDLERSSPPEALAGDSIEPMDLFYPDKEESMFTEPPDTEMQSWPSVLSVSALEPAPASELLADEQPISLLGDDFRDRLDSIQEEEKVIPETDSPSEAQEQFLLSPICAGENTEPVRADTISLLRQDESLSAPVLRHRKGARTTESTDNQRTVSRKGDKEDSDFWWSENWELCLLLLLWLLLYCFWVLPQMDLKTLPGLLLNLNR